jgi:hypothetical protein
MHLHPIDEMKSRRHLSTDDCLRDLHIKTHDMVSNLTYQVYAQVLLKLLLNLMRSSYLGIKISTVVDAI